MVGYFVTHREFGFGKITAMDGATLTVRFYDAGAEHRFEARAFAAGTPSRLELTPGTRVTWDGRGCRVAGTVVPPTMPGRAAEYDLVDEETGAAYRAAETAAADFYLREFKFPDEPLDLLLHWLPDRFATFKARDRLLNHYQSLVHQAGGIRALLASRVDLRPHQVFVAASVLMDRRQRYVLADEVGLGKTIEAGVVVADLLARRRDARVLILCPETLTRQWLAELYGKFAIRAGGRDGFRLLDLYDPAALDLDGVDRAIASVRLAAYDYPTKLAERAWDLVVVDEVHQILNIPRQYEFVRGLARRAGSLLLLSAMPARHRETELLRLLALLEPDRFGANVTDADASGAAGRAAAFLQLFRAQADIARRLSMLQDRVRYVHAARPEPVAAGAADGALSDGDAEEPVYTGEDVVRAARRLVDTPPVADDADLSARAAALAAEAPGLLDDAQAIARDVADRYRVHRRVLRNRRQRLVADAQVDRVARKCQRSFYRPPASEQDAHQAVAALLGGALAAAGGEGGAAADLLACLGRVLFHASVLPGALARVLLAVDGAAPAEPSAADREWLTTGMPGYGEWDRYLAALAAAARPHLSDRALRDAAAAAAAWRDGDAAEERLAELLAALEGQRDGRPKYKVLVFAGFPGAAAEVARYLRAHLDDPSEVAEFRQDMEQEEKEANVRRFRRRAGPWVLVSDETGGEGRNFQFVTELFHFDTPWHVSAVEQRIGRVDRLGREAFAAEVVSNVLYARDTVEHGLVSCYHDGLGVYRESISGLEFALRDVERDLALRACAGGHAALSAHAAGLAEVVRAERAADEGDALQDEAMAADQQALRLRGRRYDPEVERNLERAVLDYVRHLSGRKAQSVPDDDFPDAVWRFSPSSVTRVDLGLPANAGGLVDDVTGTFRRGVAQQRPDLRFFTIGNAFFDAVLAAAVGRHPGRAYAIECQQPGGMTWAGFEFVFRVEPDEAELAAHAGLRTRAERAVTFRRVAAYADPAGRPADAPTRKVLRDLRGGLPWDGQGKVWWPLHERHAPALRQLVDAAAGGIGWEAAVRAACAAAEVAARADVALRIGPDVAAEEGRIDQAIRLAERDAGPRAAEEVASLQALRRAVGGWRLRLDAAGFLSVNGQLRFGGAGGA